MKRTCETCAYFEVLKSIRGGFCHRFPPSWFVYTDGNDDVESSAVFIPVHKDDWCGEWSKKEEPDDE